MLVQPKAARKALPFNTTVETDARKSSARGSLWTLGIWPVQMQALVRSKSMIAAGMLAGCCCASPAWSIPGGSGVVINASTGSPVGRATVTLDCRRGLFHGSESIKKLTTHADENGRYAFSFTEVWRCGFVHVRPAKDGFVDTGSVDIRYIPAGDGAVPAKLFLTPVADARMQKLRYHAAMASGTSPHPRTYYSYVYQEFLEAKSVAVSGEEVKFVQSAFCPKLLASYASLSPDDVRELQKYHFGFPPRPFDHDGEVRAYCVPPGEGRS